MAKTKETGEICTPLMPTKRRMKKQYITTKAKLEAKIFFLGVIKTTLWYANWKLLQCNDLNHPSRMPSSDKSPHRLTIFPPVLMISLLYTDTKLGLVPKFEEKYCGGISNSCGGLW